MQLSGGSTFIISLPKTWIADLQIKVGDDVTIVKNANRSLTLYPKGHVAEKKSIAVILSNQKDSAESIKRKIIAAYLTGYKSIKINTKGMKINVTHTKIIRELVRTTMVGTEIVESSSESMTIQVLTRLPELTFVTALQRMRLMTNNMVNEAIEALENGDVSHAEDIISMDDEVNRFSLYMRRNIVMALENQSFLEEMGLSRLSECLAYRTIVSRIERIADHASLIAKRIKFLDGKIDSGILHKIKNLTEKTLFLFNQSLVAVQQKDFAKAEKTAEMKSEVIETEKKIMTELNDKTKNVTIIRFVLEDLRRIAEYSSDIAEVAIDENINKVIVTN